MGLFIKEIGILYTLSVQIDIDFVILEDPICIYNITSELVYVPYVPYKFYI